MKQFFNFETGKDFNPAKNIQKFFISPYMADNARYLDLEKKAKDNLGGDFGFEWYRGMPVAVFPINILDLGKCLIKWESTENGVIQTNHRRIYFKFINEDTVIFNTILL